MNPIKPTNIRPSSISTFVGCNYKWFRHYIMGEPMVPNVRMTAGTAVHKGAEVGYSEKISTGTPAPVSVMQDAAIEEFREKLKTEEPEMDGTDPNTWERVILTDVDLYAPTVAETPAVAVERKYKIELGGEIVKEISGTADIVLQDGIVDIKTTDRKAVPNRYTLQLSMYALLASRNENRDITTAFIHNVVHEKVVYNMPLRLNIPQVRFVVNTLIDKIDAFFSGAAPGEVLFTGNPSSPLCSDKYCNFYKTCPFVRGALR